LFLKKPCLIKFNLWDWKLSKVFLLGGIQKLFKYLLKRLKKYLREDWGRGLDKQLFF